MSVRTKPQILQLKLGETVLREPFGNEFNQVMAARRRRGDEFYRALAPAGVGDDAANVMRQALQGMLWSKQYFFYDTDRWLEELRLRSDESDASSGAQSRVVPHDRRSRHLDAGLMREYPWFAAWDLAFHTPFPWRLSTSTSPNSNSTCCSARLYLHPTGQIPAYEWRLQRCQSWYRPGRRSLSTAWSTEAVRGKTDLDFLKRMFSRLNVKFWVVGEPQGPLRPQPLRGRIFSASRQYRRF